MQDRPRLCHTTWKKQCSAGVVSYRRRTDGLVWNNLDALDVASRLEDLTQHIFSYSGVQSSHIQGSLVRFGRGATRDVAWSTTARRHGVQARVARQGRAHGGGDGVRVLGDDHRRERRGRHMLLGSAVLSVIARGSGWRWEVTSRLLLVGHCC
jgi:hypothetical protein